MPSCYVDASVCIYRGVMGRDIRNFMLRYYHMHTCEAQIDKVTSNFHSLWTNSFFSLSLSRQDWEMLSESDYIFQVRKDFISKAHFDLVRFGRFY